MYIRMEKIVATWKLITLTSFSNDHGCYQLRLWCGEPHSFKCKHVDSMGKNLILSVASTYRPELEQLASQFLYRHKIDHSTHLGIDIWRLCE